MINPSASGWIDKFFSDQKSITNAVIESTDVFYSNTRKTGFIYGYIVSLDTPFTIETLGWTEDEISKVALLNSLFGISHWASILTDSENLRALFLIHYFPVYLLNTPFLYFYIM